MHRKYDEIQCQISDNLYGEIMKYCQANNISVAEFADKINTSAYILEKAVDRRIKMHVHETLIFNIKRFLGLIKEENE